MNQQFAWVLEVRPGYEDEYKKRHDEIWPEMVDMLRKAGVQNYSIFRHGCIPPQLISGHPLFPHFSVS